MKRDLTQSIVGGIVGSLVTGVVSWGVFATADGNPQMSQVPELVPYQGRLEINGEGQSLTGTDAPWMRFELTDGSGGDVVFQQDSQVEVYSGHFSVVLGTNDGATNYVHLGSLTTAITNADDLYLHITLLNTHDPASPDGNASDNVAMNNPQRLLRSPFAFWATNSASFDVAADLEVGTTITSGQGITATTGDIAATAGNLKAGNNLQVGNKIVDHNDGTVVVGENLQAEGDFTLSGEILDASGTEVTVGNTLLVQNNLRVNNVIYDSTDDTVNVGENLQVAGNLNVQNKIYDSNDTTVVVGENFEVEGTSHFGGDQTIDSAAWPACLTINRYGSSTSTKASTLCSRLEGNYSCKWVYDGDGNDPPNGTGCETNTSFGQPWNVICCQE